MRNPVIIRRRSNATTTTTTSASGASQNNPVPSAGGPGITSAFWFNQAQQQGMVRDLFDSSELLECILNNTLLNIFWISKRGGNNSQSNSSSAPPGGHGSSVGLPTLAHFTQGINSFAAPIFRSLLRPPPTTSTGTTTNPGPLTLGTGTGDTQAPLVCKNIILNRLCNCWTCKSM